MVAADLCQQGCDVCRVLERVGHEETADAAEVDRGEEISEVDSQHPRLANVDRCVGFRTSAFCEPVDVWRRRIAL